MGFDKSIFNDKRSFQHKFVSIP